MSLKQRAEKGPSGLWATWTSEPPFVATRARDSRGDGKKSTMKSRSWWTPMFAVDAPGNTGSTIFWTMALRSAGISSSSDTASPSRYRIMSSSSASTMASTSRSFVAATSSAMSAGTAPSTNLPLPSAS